jgi:hypothetical protein
MIPKPVVLYRIMYGLSEPHASLSHYSDGSWHHLRHGGLEELQHIMRAVGAYCAGSYRMEANPVTIKLYVIG